MPASPLVLKADLTAWERALRPILRERFADLTLVAAAQKALSLQQTAHYIRFSLQQLMHL